MNVNVVFGDLTNPYLHVSSVDFSLRPEINFVTDKIERRTKFRTYFITESRGGVEICISPITASEYA